MTIDKLKEIISKSIESYAGKVVDTDIINSIVGVIHAGISPQLNSIEVTDVRFKPISAFGGEIRILEGRGLDFEQDYIETYSFDVVLAKLPKIEVKYA